LALRRRSPCCCTRSHSGLTARKATLLNAASALVAVFGTTTAIAAGAIPHQKVIDVLVPVTAGAFVYIAAADLIPELQHDHSLRGMVVQLVLISAGITVMAALTFVD
jgi:zinc and cadmium transporter